MTLTDDRGVAVSFTHPPRRIVSLLPSLTETVCALDACDRLVGVDRFSNWPESVNQLPRLGGLEDVPIEAIVQLSPDVVLADPSSRSLAPLERLGLKVIALAPRNLRESSAAIQTIATLLNRPAVASALLAQTDARIEAAAHRVPPVWRGARVYFEISSAPFAAGESSFVGELLTRLGLRNVVPARLGAFPRLNPEFVVRAAPDIVMATGNDLAMMSARPGWAGLAALRDGRSCGFSEPDYDVLVRPGPRLADAATILVSCLESVPDPTQPASASHAKPAP